MFYIIVVYDFFLLLLFSSEFKMMSLKGFYV